MSSILWMRTWLCREFKQLFSSSYSWLIQTKFKPRILILDSVLISIKPPLLWENDKMLHATLKVMHTKLHLEQENEMVT